MRHRPTAINSTSSLTSVKTESRSDRDERLNTLEYQRKLALLEEDWQNSQQQLSTPSSVESNLFDACRCCGRPDCENLDYFIRNMKKMESDTRLAAEIGQGLLHKHEIFVNESNQQRIQLEKQLKECHETITGLEQSLDDVENQKDVVTKEKNKWLWEYQKRQKIFDETLSDLQMANDKCNLISKELEIKSSELEKLRIFKFMARHSETREESLLLKLKDTNQELSVCRKNELVLESKIKKLKMRYESLYNSHEQLSRDVEENLNTTMATVNTNNTNNNNNNKLVTIKGTNDINTNNTNDLISLIKELSSANTKLKSDLMECRDQLSEARGEITTLTQKMDDQDTTHKISLRDDLIKKSNSTSTMRSNARSAAGFKEQKRANPNKRESVPTKSKTTIPPLPTISSSMPTSAPLSSSPSAIVHHHYHYYVKNSKGEKIPITDEMSNYTGEEVLLACCDTAEKKDVLYPTASDPSQEQSDMVLSPSTSSIITMKDGTVVTDGMTHSPYKLLQEHVAQVLDRLRGSDIRALNRKLKRAFDITELSSMSNSVIDNILMDVDTLESRFLWIKPTEKDVDLLSFFPLLDLLKDMLKELGILRTTMNELQVEYVKKVEESEIRVEEEIIKKRQLKNQINTTTTKPFSWLTNMFNKSKIPNDRASSITPSHCDHNSTLTKSTTNSSTLILSPVDDDQQPQQQQQQRKEETNERPPILLSRPNHHTFPRQFQPSTSMNIRPMPHFHSQALGLSNSFSNTTRSSSPSIAIRKKQSMPRMHIDYEGIGPAAIRPIPSDRENGVNYSSSWLGGK